MAHYCSSAQAHFLVKQRSVFLTTMKILLLFFGQTSVCSKQEKKNPYKEFRELIVFLEKTVVCQKVLLRPTCLYFEEILVV